MFGTPGADLTGDTITGTFSYDTSLLSQSIVGTTNTASGIGFGALSETVTIGGVSHTFADHANSSVYLDTGASEMTLQNDDSQNAGGITVAETFFLDALSISSPFVLSTDLTQSFDATSFDSSVGTFTILDTAPSGNTIASGDFTLDSLTLNGPATTPLPAALPLFATGLGALGLLGWRRKRKNAAALAAV